MKGLERVLKEHLGFGEKRIQAFMEALSEVEPGEPVYEIVRPEVNAEEFKIGHHAVVRYVERVEGLEFEEPHLSNYIAANKENIHAGVRDMLSRSKLLFSKPYKEAGKSEVMRDYRVCDEFILITQDTREKMGFQLVVTILKIKVNVPKAFAKTAVAAMVQDAIRMRDDLDQRERAETVEVDRAIKGLRKELLEMERRRDKALVKFIRERRELNLMMQSTFISGDEENDKA